LVLVINEALVCTWGNCGIHGRQPNVCMSWSVVETMISGGALWAIMTAKVTPALELLKWQKFGNP
jgi:hypothetical protein